LYEETNIICGVVKYKVKPCKNATQIVDSINHLGQKNFLASVLAISLLI